MMEPGITGSEDGWVLRLPRLEPRSGFASCSSAGRSTIRCLCDLGS